MLALLRTAALMGIEACPVTVEVDVSFGLPVFTMVGLPDASVRESRDRVRSAIRNSGFEFPAHRITVNLAPADLRKAGASFDLPIALGILAATGLLPYRDASDVLVVGELSLDGAIQVARGALPIAAMARRVGCTDLMLPRPNAPEAAVVSGLRILPVDSLADAARVLVSPDTVVPDASRGAETAPAAAMAPDLSDVSGQQFARRALEISAAGGHNLLLCGPPGAGKTMLAQRLPGILPPLTFDEALESTAIHSVAGLLPQGTGLLTERPFRAPHHTISEAALAGGGTLPRPGEISLAHNGVLFLDEIPEFSRRALEVLRQPIEEGCIRIARAARTAAFPARFVLVAAMNPCPCGFLGDPVRICRCPPGRIAHYQNRLSGPIRDRLDLTVEVPAVPIRTLLGGERAESSSAVRQRVLAARARQLERAREQGAGLNALLRGRTLGRVCRLQPSAVVALTSAAERLGLSARACHRVLRVARTIADLAADGAVEGGHVAEALQFRALTNTLT